MGGSSFQDDNKIIGKYGCKINGQYMEKKGEN